MVTKLSEVRIVLTMADEVKRLLIKAAAFEGMSLSAFVLNTATQRAHQVLENYSEIKLSTNGQMNLVELLQNPGQPSEAIKQLLSLRDSFD